jgi:L-lactate dehydrogenase
MQKVAVIGCGRVGMTAAYTMLIEGVVRELVLVGRSLDSVMGEELDLEHGLSFLHTATVKSTEDYADIAGADVVVITAGASQQPGETRLDLLAKNKAIIEPIITQVVQHAPSAVILMVTNPVDILTYHAYQIAGLPKGKIFGSGTTLDTARFRFHLSEFLHVNPRSIHAYILGEHGDSSFPVISSANVGGQPLKDFPHFSEEKATQAFEKAKNAAYTIIKSKGATYYAIGVVISKIVRTILSDAKTVLPVSIPLHNYHEHNGVALSVPCIVGKNGVEQTLHISLSSDEHKALTHSVDTLKSHLEKL